MRTSFVLMLIVPAIFLGFSSALSPVANTEQVAAVTEIHQLGGDHKFLRSLEAEEETSESEGRALNFSWLSKINKKIPGTAAFKAVAAARKAEQKKIIDMFTLVGTRDDQLYPKFAQWLTTKQSVGDAVNAMTKLGRNADEAQKIGGRYEMWLRTKKNNGLLK